MYTLKYVILFIQALSCANFAHPTLAIGRGLYKLSSFDSSTDAVLFSMLDVVLSGSRHHPKGRGGHVLRCELRGGGRGDSCLKDADLALGVGNCEYFLINYTMKVTIVPIVHVIVFLLKPVDLPLKFVGKASLDVELALECDKLALEVGNCECLLINHTLILPGGGTINMSDGCAIYRTHNFRQ